MISPTMPWGERLAIIEMYAPSDADACKVFSVSQAELDVARQLHKQGTFIVKKNVDVRKYASYFQNASPPESSTNVTVHVKPESATRKPPVPQKRGRKGDKITKALLSVPTEPTDVASFSAKHGVSLAVLRQAKRFVQNQDACTVAEIGTIMVRKDKGSGNLMIWREPIK